MKKIILGLLLLTSLVGFSQFQQYTPAADVFANPERGFYHYTATLSSSTPNVYNQLNQSTLTSYRTNEKVTVILREFYLNRFINGSAIDQTYLNSMQADFTAIRNAGIKCIVRFAYSKVENNVTPQQPTKAQILSHINQLSSVVNSNKDVITSIQAGFIGTWGEWYYTNSDEFGSSDYENWTNTQWNNRKQVLEAMATGFDSSLPLQVRYITILDKCYPNGTDRIGVYNDAFLNTWGDQGTFEVSGVNGTNSTQQAFLQQQTINLPMNGETDGTNSPRTNCAGSTTEMDLYNWTSINTDYYTPVITGWQTNGCYVEMQKLLGYRFEMIDSNLSGTNLTLKVRNVGYANVYKDRKAYLIMKKIDTGTDYSFMLEGNLKDWREDQVVTITQDVNYANLPDGTYKIYLQLPDPIANNVAYSIRCANVGTWYLPSGYNDLFQTVTLQKLGTQVFVKDNVIQVPEFDEFFVDIYDLLGRKVSEFVDISNLPTGVYIVKITSEDGRTLTKKIFKG